MGFETTVRRPLVEVALDWQTDAEPRSIAQLWRASLLTSAGRASETGAQRPPPRGPPPTTASSPKRVASTRTCPRTRSCDAQRTCARRTRSGPLALAGMATVLEAAVLLTRGRVARNAPLAYEGHWRLPDRRSSRLPTSSIGATSLANAGCPAPRRVARRSVVHSLATWVTMDGRPFHARSGGPSKSDTLRLYPSAAVAMARRRRSRPLRRILCRASSR
jgi:hypothetical protein